MKIGWEDLAVLGVLFFMGILIVINPFPLDRLDTAFIGIMLFMFTIIKVMPWFNEKFDFSGRKSFMRKIDPNETRRRKIFYKKYW